MDKESWAGSCSTPENYLTEETKNKDRRNYNYDHEYICNYSYNYNYYNNI